MISYDNLVKLAHEEPKCLDCRDLGRILKYVKYDDCKDLLENVDKENWDNNRNEYIRHNVLENLENDLKFSFEKALDCRGLSSSFMYETIKTYMYILEDELVNFDKYVNYGLPFFKAVALKYGFENPIGDDTGEESHYKE